MAANIRRSPFSVSCRQKSSLPMSLLQRSPPNPTTLCQCIQPHIECTPHTYPALFLYASSASPIATFLPHAGHNGSMHAPVRLPTFTTDCSGARSSSRTRGLCVSPTPHSDSTAVPSPFIVSLLNLLFFFVCTRTHCKKKKKERKQNQRKQNKRKQNKRKQEGETS